MTQDVTEFSDLLAAFRDGSEAAGNAMIALVYADLRQLARRHLGGARWLQSLGATQLVHESYFRLVSPAARNIRDRAHFMNLASRVMRQLICDHARRQLRGRERFQPGALPDAEDATLDPAIVAEATQLVDLDDALNDLARIAERQVRVIECRFFAGLSEEETADALAVSLRTVQREWADARDWLAEHMRGDDDKA